MTYSVKQVAQRYHVGEHTVLGWIEAEELAAVNVARSRATRPRWRITAEALQAFELLRSATPKAPTSAKRRKRTEGVIQFY